MTPEAFIAAARAYKGAPFKRGGRSRRGIDCWGLVFCSARDCGLQLPDPWPYRAGEYGRLVEACRTTWAAEFEIPVAESLPGDVVILTVPHLSPRHCAIKTDRGILHVLGAGRSVQEHSIHNSKLDVIGAFRIWQIQ